MEAIDRRRFIKGAGVTVGAAGALWAAPAVGGFISPAAAVSGSSTVDFRKVGDGGSVVPLSTVCLVGGTSNASRGTAVFTRTENPAQICVTITTSTGTPIGGREVYILQSTSTTNCVGGTTTAVGTWGNAQTTGTYCAAIVSGATRFVVALESSGGAGNQSYASQPASLP